MRIFLRHLLPLLAATSALAAPIAALEAAPGVTPDSIVKASMAREWRKIAPSDLMVMDLAPATDGTPRRVVIQLMPPPFSVPWTHNMRALVAARWYDGIAIVRVQDNYVVQWGDPDGENPAQAKPLPDGLCRPGEEDYTASFAEDADVECAAERPGSVHMADLDPQSLLIEEQAPSASISATTTTHADMGWHMRDSYAPWVEFYQGWPVARDAPEDPDETNPQYWPLHCYGTVGVGRNYSPDTGTGAELYAVIGQAPRQLDRNIAVVGRVIEGMEYLSSLPRGTGELSFYKTPQERTPIISVRLGDEVADLPGFEYLATDSRSFEVYVASRANRKDTFYVQPAAGIDICNIPVPIRQAAK
ncbi:peptidylprolyl isomerase [Novosphingobium sp. BW1]|uniref:peptidylprolyl isomerase n=1 Tax=Novosphingobium sp. BW1 TaxID=2592621 RepID=UPI0011DEBFE6|nr:peptidylprolyl isomerase [Novosphingobium sp. BW1]TYC86295.1 peptidylprolyl isomerase [Novosphingobium sp. BW1]